MGLSIEFITQIEVLKSHFASALITRAHQAQSFEATLACLKEIADINTAFFYQIEEYVGAWLIARESANPLTSIVAKRKIKQTFKEACTLFNDELMMPMINHTFQTPPVSDLQVFKKTRLSQTKAYYAGFFKRRIRSEYDITYNVEFIDGTQLVWHTMEDNDLSEIQDQFDEKIHELRKVRFNSSSASHKFS